jgi:hypothetical protein
MEMQTARLREVNAASARYREQQNLAGRNPVEWPPVGGLMLSRPHPRYGWLHSATC